MKNVLNENLDLEGKKVLLRVDLNVPMKNGAITETSRIEKILPTLNLLLKKTSQNYNYISYWKTKRKGGRWHVIKTYLR